MLLNAFNIRAPLNIFVMLSIRPGCFKTVVTSATNKVLMVNFVGAKSLSLVLS